MMKIFLCLPLRRNLFLQTLSHFPSFSQRESEINVSNLSHFPSYFSTLAEINVSNTSYHGNNNAPSQNLFLHFVTIRFNMSTSDAAKMLKKRPALGRLETLDNIEQVVSTLERYGCTEDQIASLIRSQPWLLLTSAERILEPKIQLLKDFGMWDENPNKIVTWLPWAITSKLKTLRSNLEFFKTVFPTPHLLIKAVRRNCYVIGKNLENSFPTSVAFWEDFGFRGKELTEFLLLQPWVLTRPPLTAEQCDLIRRIGIHKESKMYKYIVKVVATVDIEVIKARINSLQLCGLAIDEVLQVVSGDPSILQKSEENIKKKMEFMFNHIGLSVDFVAKHPRMFTMSLDKVMRPRFLVLQNMRAMDGAGEVNPTRLVTVLTLSEAKFVAQIIQGHPQSAALWTVYKNAIAEVSKA